MRPGYGVRHPGTVNLVCGLVCAGKTTLAKRLALELPAVRFTLDEWMLHLYGGRFDDPEYVARLENCKEVIWETALQVLNLGNDVVLDWNQWNPERRAEWRDRARNAGYPARLYFLDVSLEVAVQRARDRTAGGATLTHQIDEDGVRHFATIFVSPTTSEGLPIEHIDGA
jgi:predicted kinase